jgi:hypothetical protein
MFGEFTIIAFSAVAERDMSVFARNEPCVIDAYVISCGVEIFRVSLRWESLSDNVWLHFSVPQYSFKLGNVDHVRVKFEIQRNAHLKSCGFHLVRLCNENVNDGDGNLESNWRSQQKRHSSTLGIRFSNVEDTPPGDQS